MSGKLEIDDKGFRDMVEVLKKKTGASYEDVIKATGGAVLGNASKKTKSAKRANIVKSIENTLAFTFTSSDGIKIRRAKDGSTVAMVPGIQDNRFFRISKNYDRKAIKKDQNYGVKSGKIRNRINKALAELRKERIKRIKEAVEQIGSGKATWLEIARQAKIKEQSISPKPPAFVKKAQLKMPSSHRRAISGNSYGDQAKFTIDIKSSSIAALNKNANGSFAFSASINGQVANFQRRIKKDLEGYVKKFASKNGFEVKA